jgi:hypothetical protein
MGSNTIWWILSYAGSNINLQSLVDSNKVLLVVLLNQGNKGVGGITNLAGSSIV